MRIDEVCDLDNAKTCGHECRTNASYQLVLHG